MVHFLERYNTNLWLRFNFSAKTSKKGKLIFLTKNYFSFFVATTRFTRYGFFPCDSK